MTNAFTAHFNERRQQERQQALLATQQPGPAAAVPHAALAAVMPGLGAGVAAARAAEPQNSLASAAGGSGAATASGGDRAAAETAAATAAAAAAAAAASSGAVSRRSNVPSSAQVQEWLQVASRNRIGPKLQALREEHRQAGLPIERYGMAHVHKLGTSRHQWVQQQRVYCKNIHRKRDRGGASGRCTLCTTCHWCRQKTTCEKTRCSACHGNKDNIYGGPYAGVTCGNCLWTRFGENLNEVVRDPNWLCPACRQICNCSANNCVRAKNGWICTDQIHYEAKSLDYKSAAHYLVLSQLDELLLANITDNVNSLQPMVDREVTARAAAARRPRNEKDTTTRLQEASVQLAQRELAAVHAASGFSGQRALEVASHNQQVLAAMGFGRGTLAEDLQDEDDEEDDEDDEDELATPATARGSLAQPAGSMFAPATSGAAAAEAGVGGGSLERWAHLQHPGAAPLASLLPGISGGSGRVTQSGLPTRRLPPRPPGRLPQQTVTHAAAEAEAVAGRLNQAGQLNQAGHLPAPAHGGRPGAAAPALLASPAAAAAAAASGSGSGLPGQLGGPGAGGAAAAVGAADSSARVSEAGNVGASGADQRQEQLDGLLHRDRDAAFPDGPLAGQGPVAGYRPAARGAAAGAQQAPPGALQASMLQHPRLRLPPQQQGRLTPLVAAGSRQQQAAAGGGTQQQAPRASSHPPQDQQQLRAGSAEPSAVRAQQQRQQEEGRRADGRGGVELDVAAEPSQQLGLSPGAAELLPAAPAAVAAPAAAMGDGQELGAAAVRAAGHAAAAAALAAPAATPAPGPAPPLAGGSGLPAGSGDLLWWSAQLQRAKGLIAMIERHDPVHPTYEPHPAARSQKQADAVYQLVHDRNLEALLVLLTQANQCFTEFVVVNRLGDSQNRRLPIDALRPLIDLYLELAAVLPAAEVQYHVMPRLLGGECFVDFQYSSCPARMMLIDGMIDLLATLSLRQLEVKDACVAIAGAVTTLAEELHDTSELLSEMKEALQGGSLQQLPTRDRRIGAYHYNAAERGRDMGAISSQLDASYTVLEDMLQGCLVRLMYAADLLGHDAAHLLTSGLAAALLGADRSMPRDVKISALGLVFMVLSFSSQATEQTLSMQLTAVQMNQIKNRWREQRPQLCKVLRDVVPRLEGLVAAEYTLWRPAAGAAGAAAPVPGIMGGAAAGMGALSGQGSRSDHLGDKGVTTLARAYAFLLECEQMTWREMEAAALRPYTSLTSFWQLSNRMYRYFSMALMTSTLQHVPKLQVPDQHECTKLLKHFLNSVLDRGKRFMTVARFALALSKLPQLAWLFVGVIPPLEELAIGSDRSGEHTASLLGTVVGRLAADAGWCPHLADLLQDVDEMVEKREKETVGNEDRTRRDRLRYGSRLYRLLAAILKAATPVALAPAVAAAPAAAAPGRWGGPSTAGVAGRLRKLAQRMALLAVSSCLAVHREYRISQAAVAAAATGGVLRVVLPEEEAACTTLVGLGNVRQRFKGLPFGHLGSLWDVLLAWGAPAAFATDLSLLRPLWTVVCCALDLCSGKAQANYFDRAVLEQLATSLLPSDQQQQQAPQLQAVGNQQASASHLQQLRDYVLSTLVRRYLERSHLRHVSNERGAVNAVRFLEALLEGIRSKTAAETALLPLLPALLGVLWIHQGGAEPSQAAKEAVHRMLAKQLTQGPLAQLLPPFCLPRPAAAGGLSREQQGQQRVRQTLHAFWTAVASDALLCCYTPVLNCLGQGDSRRQLIQAELASSAREPKLLPLTATSASAAGNTLVGLLQKQTAMDAVERLWQQHGMQVELLVKDELAAAAAASDHASFRPASFSWELAAAGLDLLAAFLQVGGAAAAAEAAAGMSPGPRQPAAAAAEAEAGWQALPAGYQWALACMPALKVLILRAGKAAGRMLWDQYFQVQEAAAAAMPLHMHSLQVKDPRKAATAAAAAAAAQAAAATLQAARAAAAAQAAGQLPQRQGGMASAPAASSIGGSAAAASRLLPDRAAQLLDQQQQQQQWHIKQEPLTQATVPAQQQQQQPSGLRPRQQEASADAGQKRQRIEGGDVCFADVAQRCSVNVVGLLTRPPKLKEPRGGGVAVLQLDLRDECRRRLALLVKPDHAAVVELRAQAAERFSRQDTELLVLRATRVTRLGGSGAATVPSSSGGASNCGVAEQGVTCLLPTGSRIEWEPSGQAADRVYRAIQGGRLQVSSSAWPGTTQQQEQQQQLGTQATVCTATQRMALHHPETQATPLVSWPQQQQQQEQVQPTQMPVIPMRPPPAAARSPTGSVVQEGGGRWGQHPATAPYRAAGPAASEAQQSQAAARPPQQRPQPSQQQQRQQQQQPGLAARAGASQWLQLASQVLQLLPGMPRKDVINALKVLGRADKQFWESQSVEAVAAEVARRLT